MNNDRYLLNCKGLLKQIMLVKIKTEKKNMGTFIEKGGLSYNNNTLAFNSTPFTALLNQLFALELQTPNRCWLEAGLTSERKHSKAYIRNIGRKKNQYLI